MLHSLELEHENIALLLIKWQNYVQLAFGR